MTETGYMNFFNVKSCGLYKIGSKVTYGCELEETFDLIKAWVKNRPLADTIPWDTDSARRDIAKYYCKDIHKDKTTKDFFLVLWKSDTDSAGTLWGAQEDTQTGSGNVVKYTNQYKGKKVIWGRPSYYWVIPEYNVIVSIKFDHSVTDSQLFEQYVTACINNRVQHANRKRNHTEKGFVRISYNDDNGIKYSYRFKKKLKSINTSDSHLLDLSRKVTHIIRRETIAVHSKDERAEWVKIFNEVIPLVSAKPKSKKRKIEVKAEAKPNLNEIKEIIEMNANEGRKPTDWDNVGFMTDTGTTWVDKYRLRDHITIVKDPDHVLSAEELFREISSRRDNFLKLLKEDQTKPIAEAQA